MKPSALLTAALAAVALAAPLSHAAEFNQVQSQQSSIGFSYQQMGVPMDGKFRKFSSRIAFDPAQPAKAQAAFDIDLASIDTGGAESDEEVAGKSWFNTASFPKANFTVRNLGWSGDTVWGEARAGFDPPAKGYERLISLTKELNPTVLLVSYGANESFEGEAGLQTPEAVIARNLLRDIELGLVSC